ncbi:hypothetical protein, partial [Sinorhizobium kostiense]|uniref:hypothetical protein n=1 Tax=Sinorhizobium kostiense TaxID=76747 RepID=UPI001AE89E8D
AVCFGYAARQPGKHSAPLEPTELFPFNPERLWSGAGAASNQTREDYWSIPNCCGRFEDVQQGGAAHRRPSSLTRRCKP